MAMFVSKELVDAVQGRTTGVTVVSKRNPDGSWVQSIVDLDPVKQEYMNDSHRLVMSSYRASRWQRVKRALFG